MDPVILVALIGLFSSTSAYLAGRNRLLVKSYKQLIADLRLEIDRLKGEVAELRELLSTKTRTRNKS